MEKLNVRTWREKNEIITVDTFVPEKCVKKYICSFLLLQLLIHITAFDYVLKNLSIFASVITPHHCIWGALMLKHYEER